MKPLYVKKNGVVYKISGNGMPASYPAENVEYDNTVTSELQATDVQSAIDELSTRQGGVQSDWDEDDTTELDYIKNKPQNLVQDANYVHTDNNYDATAKGKVDSLGTAASKNVGVANGVAELDAAGKVPSSQLPSFVDDVIEVADYDHLPITGESGKIYVTLDTNKTYRWTGSGYAEISESLALGETSSTAYRGDRGKAAYDHSQDSGRITSAVSSGLYKFSATAQGHISGATAVQKSDITALGIPGQDTTYNDATTSVSGLMSANDKIKLGNIAVARFGNTADSQSKKIKIKINNESRWMIVFTVTLYKDYKATKVMVSGYNFTSYWHRPAAVILGKSYDDNVNVYFGYDSLNNLWVGFDGGSYKGVSVSDVANGFQQISNYDGLFTISEVDTLTTLQTTLVATSTTRVESSTTNGNIKIDSVETPVYRNYGNNTVLTTDKTPFLTRQTLNPTGFSGYVREKLVGASYAWNQLCENGDFSNDTQGWTLNRFSGSVSSNICTLTLIATGDNYADRVCYQGIAGHKYLVVAKVKPSSSNKGSFALRTYYNGTGNYADYVFQNNNTWQFGMIIIAETTGGLNNRIRIRDGSYNQVAPVVGDNANVTCCMVIDLTLAFGSTIADYLYSITNNGAITKLRDMGFPIDKYTPYGYGLYSVKTSGKKIVGKNLFDIDTVLVGKVTNGLWSWGGSTSKLFDLKFKANTQYTFSGYETQSGENKNVRPRIVYTDGTVENIFLITNTTRTAFTKTSAANKTIDYIQAYWGSDSNAYVTIENFQIEISTSATTYEPYSSTTYPLGNDELRGKFDLVNGEIVASGDVKESNGIIDRIWGVTDFADLTWSRGNNGGAWNFYFFYANISGMHNSVFSDNDIVCSKYLKGVGRTLANAEDKSIITANNSYIYIRDDSYTDAATFKTAMTGQKIQFIRATPTTEQSTPFADPMSMVGATTEEYIDTRDIPCPVGAERQYMGQSEDVVEIPSSPQSDGKRILISEISGGKEQVYWDSLTKLNYHDYTVKGDGTTTWGDLLNSLRPIYESLSEDEKTFSKLIFRPESISGNECLSYCGAYWYSRMGLNSNKTLWIDHASLGPNSSLTYYYQKNGDTFIDQTSNKTTYSLSLRVFVEVGNNS